jgi:hypothetical protein
MGLSRRHGWISLFAICTFALGPTCRKETGGGSGSPPDYFTATTDSVLPLTAGSIDLGPSADFVALADGRVLIGDRLANQVHLLNVVTGIVDASYQLTSAPGDLEYDPSRLFLYATLSGASFLARIDLVSGVVTNIAIPAAAASITRGPGGLLFASMPAAGSYWGPVALVDGVAGVLVKSFPGGSGFSMLLAFDATGNQLITGDRGLSPSSLTRYAYDSVAQTLTLTQSLWDSGGNGQDLAVSPDGGHIAFPCGGGNAAGYTIVDFSTADLNVSTGEWNTGPYPRSAVFSLDGSRVVALNDWDLFLFDAGTHAQIQKFTPTFGSCSYAMLSRAGISRGGKIAYAYTDCGFGVTSGKLYWFLLP